MKFWKFGFWTLVLAFKKFFGLFLIFLRSLMLKQSSGMQESYMWVVFHPYKITNQNFHSSSLCWIRYYIQWSNKSFSSLIVSVKLLIYFAFFWPPWHTTYSLLALSLVVSFWVNNKKWPILNWHGCAFKTIIIIRSQEFWGTPCFSCFDLWKKFFFLCF